MLSVVLMGAIVALAATADGPAQSRPDAPPKFTVKACRLEYKPEAQGAYFNAVVKYELITDTRGLVVSATEDPTTRRGPALRPVLEPLVSCLKSWVLEPDTRYSAELHWGHGVPNPWWHVCRVEGGCIELTVSEQ